PGLWPEWRGGLGGTPSGTTNVSRPIRFLRQFCLRFRCNYSDAMSGNSGKTSGWTTDPATAKHCRRHNALPRRMWWRLRSCPNDVPAVTRDWGRSVPENSRPLAPRTEVSAFLHHPDLGGEADMARHDPYQGRARELAREAGLDPDGRIER